MDSDRFHQYQVVLGAGLVLLTLRSAQTYAKRNGYDRPVSSNRYLDGFYQVRHLVFLPTGLCVNHLDLFLKNHPFLAYFKVRQLQLFSFQFSGILAATC